VHKTYFDPATGEKKDIRLTSGMTNSSSARFTAKSTNSVDFKKEKNDFRESAALARPSFRYKLVLRIWKAGFTM